MPRNGSGTYSIPNSLSPGTDIQSSPVNANFSDAGSEITNSLPRDGQAAMTGQFKAANGTIAAPGISFGSDTNSGLYRKSGDVLGVVVGGTEIGTFAATGWTGGAPNLIETGTVMLFAQTAAPTGWTKSTTHDDKALRIVSGAASSGGATAFSSVLTSRTILEANLPAHTHGPGDLGGTTDNTDPNSNVSSGGGSAKPIGSGANNAAGTASQSVNSQNHGHDFTVTTGVTGSTGSGTAIDFAVQYVDVILATKD